MSLRRVGSGLVTIATAAALVVSIGPAHAERSRGVASKVRIAAPVDVTQGDRFSVVARIARPAQATRVMFQYKKTNVYAYQSLTRWTTLKTVKVRGRAKVGMVVQADEAKEAFFRAVVTYRGARKPTKSSAARVDYWHWQALASPYYSAGSATDFLTFTMAGRSTDGWRMYGGSSAEWRSTLIGSCKEFKATVGLTDQSADGSTGAVTFSTIDPATTAVPLWASPMLVPGRTIAVDVPLSSPYRFSIFGQNTSAPVTDSGGRTITPAAYPAVADPEFLCHQD